MAKRYHHGDLRRALLDAARALVAEHGPHGFTMAQAARRVGVSSGAPYRHFEDRMALLRALCEEGQAALESRVAEATAGIDDPGEVFRQTGIVFAVFAVDEPGWYRVMMMPELVPITDEHPDVSSFWRPFAELVASTGPEESLPTHPLVAQFAARALVIGLAQLLVQGSLQPLGVESDRARQLADAITRYMNLSVPPE